MKQSSLYRAFLGTMLVWVLAMSGVTVVHAAIDPPVPVRMVSPDYPYELKRDGVEGVVMLSFEVTEKGDVVDPKVLKSSNPRFAQPALDAIVKWKFKPARKDGVPVKIRIAIPLQFKIDD